MKRLLFLFIFQNFFLSSFGQNFLNGSFENNSVTNCMINSITNAQFNSLMNNVKGIGATETIDIFYDTDCPFYGTAQSGHYFVSVENNSTDSTQSTALSLKLADTLQAGNSYSFCFYDRGLQVGVGPIVIGISNTDSTFGTVIYTPPTADTTWTQRTVSFIAPINARFVTVKYGSFIGGAIVDNFGICNGTGLNEQTNIENLLIFPNPFSDYISITSSSNDRLEIFIYDFLGQQVLKQSLSNSTTINTEQIAKGLYLYEVRNISGVIKKGVVVKQ